MLATSVALVPSSRLPRPTLNPSAVIVTTYANISLLFHFPRIALKAFVELAMGLHSPDTLTGLSHGLEALQTLVFMVN